MSQKPLKVDSDWPSLARNTFGNTRKTIKGPATLDSAFVVLDSNEGIFAMPPARGEPVRQKEDCYPYDIGLVFKNRISLSGQDKFRLLENVWKPTDLFGFPGSIDNGKSRKFTRHC